MQRHKVFISYHHESDQWYKEELIRMGKEHAVFIDKSVGDGDISEDLLDAQIRRRIRDDYLRDSTVTIVLVGTETKRRKHVDWEIYSSMYNGKINKQSGVLVVNLPTIDNELGIAAHWGEESAVYPDIDEWIEITSRREYESRFPYMPSRIIDNLVAGAPISVAPWNRINANRLSFLIDATFNERLDCRYDLSSRMRRANS